MPYKCTLNEPYCENLLVLSWLYSRESKVKRPNISIKTTVGLSRVCDGTFCHINSKPWNYFGYFHIETSI